MSGADKNPGGGVFDWLGGAGVVQGAAGRIYNGDRLSEKWGVARYPMAGNRNLASSALSEIGTCGVDWSSSVSGANGLFLAMYSARVWPAYTHARSYGFSVRCLHI